MEQLPGNRPCQYFVTRSTQCGKPSHEEFPTGACMCAPHAATWWRMIEGDEEDRGSGSGKYPPIIRNHTGKIIDVG